jgi:ribosome-binding ATPase YchF (GTP1/OBG family)
MKAFLIGRPGSGRETVFQALTGQGQTPGHQDTRQGEALVADPRLDYLSSVFKPRKHTPARLDLCLPKPQAEPNKALKASLEKAREADVLLAVLAGFPDPSGRGPDPVKDAALLASELKAADFVTVSSRLERIDEDHKRGRKADPTERGLLVEAQAKLEAGLPLRDFPELAKAPKLRGFGLLSSKPMLALVNLPDDARGEPELALETPHLCLKGRLEEEFSLLSPEEAGELMGVYGLTELGAARVAGRLRDLMDLVSFFTVGEDECRAWTVSRGDTALTAAGQIHSDIQKGFIRAEVVSFDDFKTCGGFGEVKKRGLFRLESKGYQVADGDIIHFRFNV